MHRLRVYVETTIPSYLASKSSRDVLAVARQRWTRAWWHERRKDFDLFVSQMVLDEAGRGRTDLAAARIAVLRGLPVLAATDKAVELARRLIAERAVPKTEPEDALHLALAAAHEMDFLLTWNCAHLANAEIQWKIEAVLERAGLRSPRICTPQELLAGA